MVNTPQDTQSRLTQVLILPSQNWQPQEGLSQFLVIKADIWSLALALDELRWELRPLR